MEVLAMCGFAGLLAREGNPDEHAEMAAKMSLTLSHRGPDDDGEWADPGGQAAFGFRRLSIIDLTSGGHQPMTSADGRYTVAFNGEIYKFAAVRRELEAGGMTFRGRSDTEVLVATVSRWGPRVAIPRLWGMFAFALRDASERRVYLVRDRVGKKPLYYGWFGNVFLFGLELKALRAQPAFERRVDRTALASFLRFSYVPSPASIYEGVKKVHAASWVTVRPDRPGEVEGPQTYWDPLTVALAGQRDLLRLDDDAAIEELERLLPTPFDLEPSPMCLSERSYLAGLTRPSWLRPCRHK